MVNQIAVESSTNGYLQGMGRLQSRQRPRSKNQLSNGILSYQRTGALHSGHCEPGFTIERCPGRREMQTLRKLPKIRPKTNPTASYAIRELTEKVYGDS